MRAIGLLVCGRGEGDRYLSRTLDDLERLCDDVVVAGNDTDPKTERMIRERDFFFYRDDREWGRHQPEIKTDLLNRIARLRPDWVVPLDADESFSGFGRADLEALARTNALGYYFYIVNLWNSPDRYWAASSFWNVRAFRFAPEFGTTYLRRNVHCGLAPPYAYQYGRYAPFHVEHFGLMKREDRLKKVERYKLYDPRKDKVGIGAYYQALESDGPGQIYVPADVAAKVRAEVERMGQKDKDFRSMAAKTREFCIVRRLKDGVELDIPKSDLERTLATGGFEFVRDVVVDEAPKIEAPVKEDRLECPLCGAAAASEAQLARHKTKEHGSSDAGGKPGEEPAEEAPAAEGESGEVAGTKKVPKPKAAKAPKNGVPTDPRKRKKAAAPK